MKNLLIALPLFFAPSCKAIDSALGIGVEGEAQPERSDEAIQAAGSAIQTTGDLILPGAGGVLATLFVLGARAYVKRRKAAAAA